MRNTLASRRYLFRDGKMSSGIGGRREACWCRSAVLAVPTLCEFLQIIFLLLVESLERPLISVALTATHSTLQTTTVHWCPLCQARSGPDFAFLRLIFT